MQPSYAPNTVNQTVSMNGRTFRGQPNQGWTDVTNETQTTGNQQAVSDAATVAQNKFDTLKSSNDQSVTDFLSKYKTDTGNAISDASAQFHLPEQTDVVNSLNTRINQLKTNFSNSGAGGFANNDQVDAAINSRYLPQLETATGNLATSTAEAQAQEGIALQPDQQYGQLLATNITTAMSGLSSIEQTIMTGILGKLQSGTSLTEAEWTNANNIAQKLIDQATATTTQQLKNQYQTVPAGSYLINTLGKSGSQPFYAA